MGLKALFEDDCALALCFLCSQCSCGPATQAAIDRIKAEAEHLSGVRETSPYSSEGDDPLVADLKDVDEDDVDDEDDA